LATLASWRGGHVGVGLRRGMLLQEDGGTHVPHQEGAREEKETMAQMEKLEEALE